jgi:hypothetical protein
MLARRTYEGYAVVAAQTGGVHLIHVNAAGFDRLKRGGSTPYPDGDGP